MHHQIIEEDFLRTLWEIDSDPKRKQTKEEQLCEAFYEKTYTRNTEGRYVVKLPFKYDNLLAPNGNTRQVAMKRLLQQEKRLQKSPDLREEYEKGLEEYLRMGHMEEVPQDELDNKSVYLPHHAVVRRDKETTKVRVVYDASCKGENGISLNDELLVGPVLQEDLRSITMRWRMYKICFVSDVVKMYRMVVMHKEHRDYHRLLWRRVTKQADNQTNGNDDIKDFRLCTVTFGTASAPYLAIKTFMKIAEEEGAMYPDVSRIIREDTYVDDIMSGMDTVDQAIQVSKDLIKVLQRGGFELQKWASNNADFLKSLNAEQITTKVNLDMKLDGMIKALGLSWNIGNDEFQYQLQLEPMTEKVTKRTVLSDLQKLFDPLGWIAPTIVTAKILVQKLWLEGVGWDEEVKRELKEEWQAIREDLENVCKVKIKRWINTLSSEINQITLHGFCDASIRAYAAVVYCRVITECNEVKTHLIAARTKVAPVRTISLPRLELSGAALLAKLLQKVSHAMRVPPKNVFAWTDSTIVLAWLSGEPNRWKPFVANRVVEIIEQVSSNHWFHVQSSSNPADVASRGSSISELQQNNMWWYGPAWLLNESIEFTKPLTSSTDLEKKNNIQSYLNITTSEEKCIKYENYESLTELLRVIVHCKRFLNRRRHPDKLNHAITTEEIQDALDICIKQSQEEFLEDIKRLGENKIVSKTSKLKTLNPYIDKKNILRVGGRLRNANVDEDMKHPVILGKRNELVPLIIKDAHLKTMHGGIKLMITYLMSKYWIIGCKGLVKYYIHKCLTCARQRANNTQQLMGDLPESRVTPARPFSRCGVDFAGPVHVLNHKGRGAKTGKAYICIFICMAVKAIHLELVSDLTSSAFIAAFKRFVSRRGRCHEIWSDNGSSFVASDKELSVMFKESGLEIPGQVADKLANEGTQWHFLPPYSPNFAGLWEAGVKSVKQHLRKTLTANLTFEEFATVLTQIEACLNSRPLTPISTDVDVLDDIQVLTPGHFICGEALVTVPDRDYSQANMNLLTRWQHTQRLVQLFWKRWQTEYLSRLNQRPKWLKRMPEFRIGDIVLLKEENTPPSKWALARIMEKHPGHDDLTRVYTVRYNGKLTRRSISKLCPLPISVHDE
ncbi:uncharacterized protein LOC106137125 [Amyelois transitella]|uniref:uncharacterized protein LOC106137125 n=1 Tax=Amyelois transitella TaxID=680683 RepID=UPI00298FE943|nr:uncharacterized protein LOC106137125 [Amyelois transitella]